MNFNSHKNTSHTFHFLIFFPSVRAQFRDVLFYVEQHGLTAHWKKLGAYLGIPFPELDVIEVDRAKADDRMMALLDFWLRTGAATKQELINALRKTTKTMQR